MSLFEDNKKRVIDDYERLINRKNAVADCYNGIYDRYVNPVLTADHAPYFWKYDMDPKTNSYFMERLGINAVLNSGALYMNGKYYLVARVEGNDRKSFFAVAESDKPTEGFRFHDYPVLLPDTEKEETNVYDMRLTQHEDGWIYGVFCSESKDKDSNDLSAAVAQAGIVRTKDLKTWERLPNLKSKSPQQRNVVLHPEFVDGKYAFYTLLRTISFRQAPAAVYASVCARISTIPSSAQRKLLFRPDSTTLSQRSRTVQALFRSRRLRAGYTLLTVSVTLRQV